MAKTLIKRKDPVILLGIHRSGTSLLAELLTDMGIFMGRKQNAHIEAWHFLNNNKKILDFSHADWDIPTVFESLLKSEKTTEAVLEFMKSETTDKKMIRQFFGNKLALKERIQPSHRFWGWKDPRTSITFPLWNKIYPEANFILVLRNGVDVANSMTVREDDKLTNIHSKATSTRCQTLEESFKVWEEYNDFFEKHQDQIAPGKLLIIKYEDLLKNCPENLKRIAAFIDLKNADEKIEEASKKVNPEHASKFQLKPELLSFYESVKSTKWMKKYNY